MWSWLAWAAAPARLATPPTGFSPSQDTMSKGDVNLEYFTQAGFKWGLSWFCTPASSLDNIWANQKFYTNWQKLFFPVSKMFGDDVLGIGTSLSGFHHCGFKGQARFHHCVRNCCGALCPNTSWCTGFKLGAHSQMQVGAQAASIHQYKYYRLHLYIYINITGWIPWDTGAAPRCMHGVGAGYFSSDSAEKDQH